MNCGFCGAACNVNQETHLHQSRECTEASLRQKLETATALNNLLLQQTHEVIQERDSALLQVEAFRKGLEDIADGGCNYGADAKCTFEPGEYSCFPCRAKRALEPVLVKRDGSSTIERPCCSEALKRGYAAGLAAGPMVQPLDPRSVRPISDQQKG